MHVIILSLTIPFVLVVGKAALGFILTGIHQLSTSLMQSTITWKYWTQHGVFTGMSLAKDLVTKLLLGKIAYFLSLFVLHQVECSSTMSNVQTQKSNRWSFIFLFVLLLGLEHWHTNYKRWRQVISPSHSIFASSFNVCISFESNGI